MSGTGPCSSVALCLSPSWHCWSSQSRARPTRLEVVATRVHRRSFVVRRQLQHLVGKWKSTRNQRSGAMFYNGRDPPHSHFPCELSGNSRPAPHGDCCHLSREPVMPAYRVYFFGKDGHVDGAPTVIDCPSDKAVIEKAKNLRNRRRPIEIWDLARLVARLDSSDD
jgi:hypothetical protein